MFGGSSRSASLPKSKTPSRKIQEGIEGMSTRSGLDWILTEKELEPIIKPLIEKPGTALKEFIFH